MERNNNKEQAEPVKPSCGERFRTRMRNAGHFLYNSETKEVLGRSGLSWLKVLSFYLAFYCCLAGFWATCMVVFIRTLDPTAPTMQKMYSMMKDNPGMNFEPFPDNTKTLIQFTNSSNISFYQTYYDQVDNFYQDYANRSKTSNLMACNMNNSATLDQACAFNINDFISPNSSCSQENKYGYQDGKPCVVLRINRVYAWQPNGMTFDVPCGTGDITCDKKNEFENLSENVRTTYAPGYIGVSCTGENDGDVDNIIGVNFIPPQGFPAYYFPYYNQPDYISPAVIAQFDVQPGRASMILCQIWTHNIIHDKNDLQGSIHFELMVGP